MKKIIMLLLIFSMVGCWYTTPVRYPGEALKCYKERECNYNFRDSEDKTQCLQWANECSKYIDFEYCRDPKNRTIIEVENKWGKKKEKSDFYTGCWDILR